MRSILFEGETLEAYEALRASDKRLHRSLLRILKELQRGDPSKGTGKPEPLKYGMQGLWSRRLSPKDRLVYSFDAEAIHIVAIGGHYDQK